jgi:hypothetical protein
MRRRKHRPARTREVEHGQAAFIADDRLAVDKAMIAPAVPPQTAASGKFVARSLPFLLMRRTPEASRRAMMRKPSCLMS